MTAKEILREIAEDIVETYGPPNYEGMRPHLHKYSWFEDAFPDVTEQEWMEIVRTALSK